ncbi:MAG TPA: DNA glycosylase [Fimbriimonas sp.]|nr:DNA glycosylase [Fimbriimonas sp.]
MPPWIALFTYHIPDTRLDISLCVMSGQVFRWQRLEDGRWLGVDGPNWFLVEAGDELQVTSNAPEHAFHSLFRLDWNAEEIEREIARVDPALKPYMVALRGLRLMRPSSPEEVFFTFLCTPNNNVTRIAGMVSHLASYGEPIDEVEGQTIHRFPSAEVIAAIPSLELREKKFGYRAETIVAAAQQMLAKEPNWLESLKTRPYPEAHEELLTIKGIGRKLSDCIALFGLDHTEAVPIDTHIWQQVVRLYRPEWRDKTLTDSRYLEAGDLLRTKFGKVAGWAQQYLFYDNLANWRNPRN